MLGDHRGVVNITGAMSLGYLFVIQSLFHNCRPSVLGDRSSIKGSGLFGCRMSFYVMFFFSVTKHQIVLLASVVNLGR